MLESYVFLSQIPDEILKKKQKEVIEKFCTEGSCIYYICDGFHTKVGKADYPLNRLRELQTGNPRKLILVGVRNCRKYNAVEEEREIQKYFSDKLIRGEWFFLTDSDLHEGFYGPQIFFTDYFADPVFFREYGFYKQTHDIQRNINDRIGNAYCRNPYYPNINRN